MFLFGASGHGKVVAEIIEENNLSLRGFIDGNTEVEELLGYKVFHQIPPKPVNVILSIGDNGTRKRLATKHPNFKYPVLIHPKAIVSKRTKIGGGTVIMAGVSVNADVKIGRHVIVNTNASVDHDCILHDYVHVSPNVGLAGNVEVGEGTHIGIGACVIPGIKIGRWCRIGAGAVIIRDVPDGATVVGNPGKVIKERVFSDN